MVRRIALAGLLGALLWAPALWAADREVPESLAPFDYLIGSWKGQGVPTANRVRGWNETHQWAWKFQKGRPVGLTFTIEGGKLLSKGQLTYDEAAKQYKLEGTDPAGKPVAYAGKLGGKSGKNLTLDRVGATPEGKQQLTLFPNSNLVRYSIWASVQEPGAPQFKRVTEVGVTKEGESFAAGASAADLPKCILTGGAATMTVNYQGKSYPICCTGCRDEFNENPEKYVKKAALMAESGGDGKKPVKSAAASRGKDDGSFDGLVEDAPKEDMPKEKSRGKSAPKAKKAAEPEADDEAAGSTKPEAPAAESAAAKKAASLYRLAQNLERGKKPAAALGYYRQIVKDYPGTPQAKDAAARIKALGGK